MTSTSRRKGDAGRSSISTILVAAWLVISSSTAFAQDAVLIEAANALGQYLSLQSPPVLESISPHQERTDGLVIWHPALNGEKGVLFVSFESGVEEGAYLRCEGDALVVEKDDGIAGFAEDASFRVSFSSGGSLTLESVSHPGYFIRHRGASVSLEQSDQSAIFSGDTAYFRIPYGAR